ncbi:helix-turn-helix domain-containing protein [Brevibacillus agri]|uniref:helix-turn-helix domain-containing protein n=1 Tax=Brevibacillus agri TaxID=51101 RepID=UPI002E21759C
MGECKTIQRSLRSEIEHHLKERGYTLTRLSEITGINQGVLSDLLNRIPPRSMKIAHLDAFADAFGQSQGWLYELYESECELYKVRIPRKIGRLSYNLIHIVRDCLKTINWMPYCNLPMYAFRCTNGKR